MLVYGDAARVEDPRDRLAALAEALGRIPGMAAGIARHAALVAVLIDAGELAQGLADEAAFVAAAGRQDRCPSPAQAAAMALLMRLARAVGASWESGFARLVPLPSPARIRSLAGRLHRGDAPARRCGSARPSCRSASPRCSRSAFDRLAISGGRNFNPIMATAAKVTVAQVEHLVRPGEIDPDHIHTPGIFVQRLIQCPPGYEKRIEQRTVRKPPAAAAAGAESQA